MDTQLKPVEKVAVKLITIIWAEGYTPYCDKFPKTFNSFHDVNVFLLSHANQFPTLGYDKHKFNVVWNDNDLEGYTGRLDCQHYTCTNNDLDIGQHIREFLQYTIDQNDSYLMDAQNMLDNYQLT